MPLKAIAAMSENRVIGLQQRLPWNLPSELRWFKQMTSGHTLLMGRKTYETIGRPLPGRHTIVLTRSGRPFPGTVSLGDLTSLLSTGQARDIFVCGGAEVFAQTLPFCSDLYLSLIKRSVAGDTFFPPFEELFQPREVLLDGPDFRVTHYCRRPEAPHFGNFSIARPNGLSSSSTR